MPSLPISVSFELDHVTVTEPTAIGGDNYCNYSPPEGWVILNWGFTSQFDGNQVNSGFTLRDAYILDTGVFFGSIASTSFTDHIQWHFTLLKVG
jgi:hypothetical protein